MDVDDMPNSANPAPSPNVMTVNAEFVSSITTTLSLLNQRIEQLQSQLEKTTLGGKHPRVFSDDVFLGDTPDRKSRRTKRTPQNNAFRVSYTTLVLRLC
jgi:hypothetical protein